MPINFADYAILWDMDGVLIDTELYHEQAWMETFAALEHPITRQVFKETFGMNNASILETILGERPSPEKVDEIGGQKEELFRALIHGKAELLPGVRDWLDQFKAWGMPMAMASSAPVDNIDALVDELEVRSYFDALVSGADLPGKPNPDVYLKAAKMIGAAPSQCIVIEDAIAGVAGALAAEMKCIAVTTTNPAEALKAAHLVLPDLRSLTVGMVESLLD